MSDHYFIYTVSGGPDVYYAAVDRATGRVWTSPTKEAAHRQAREAGLTTFTERMISREALLKSLGIDNTRPMRIDPEETARHSAARPEPSKSSKTPWFVAGGGTIEPASSMPPIPKLHRGKRNKPGRGARGKSPFTENRTITPSNADDDILIVPAADNTPGAPAPFTDEPAGGKDASTEEE